VAEQGLVDQEWIDGRTTGFAQFKESLQDYTPARVAEITGIAAEEIETAAKAFAEAKNGIILFGLEAGNDPGLRAALEALALVTGHAGKPDNGLIAVLPHANSRGALDMGLLPDQLPGYQPVERVPGLSAQAMLSEGSPIKGMLLAGVDPAAESEAYRTALEQLDFLVVQELFLTETAKLADVVLPAKGVAERDGTYTNVERRVQTFDPGVPAPGQTWADWLILSAIAGQMGADWTYASADGVMAEITRKVPLYTGMEFRNLVAPVSLERKTAHYIYEGMSFTADVREGLQWAALAEKASDRIALRFIAPAPVPDDEAEFTLVAPRVLYDDGRLLAEAELMQPHLRRPQLLVSRADAAKLGLANDDSVTVSHNGISVSLPVQVNRQVAEGVVLVARNLPGRPAERLTDGNGLYTTVTVKKS
jgi:predicted molibdopterin-dependent oxidoreductase YjgC